MIYDPTNIKIAMDEKGVLYTPGAWRTDEKGNPIPEWCPMVEVNYKGDFRRPIW